MLRLGLVLVRGRSMEPTLHEGDRLLVLYGAPPRRGRLAVVRLPDTDSGPRPLSVKRVVGQDPSGGDGWWVERDNPREGVDSWLVGAIPRRDVRAVVLTRVPAPRLPAPLRRLGPGLARGLRRRVARLLPPRGPRRHDRDGGVG